MKNTKNWLWVAVLVTSGCGELPGASMIAEAGAADPAATDSGATDAGATDGGTTDPAPADAGSPAQQPSGACRQDASRHGAVATSWPRRVVLVIAPNSGLASARLDLATGAQVPAGSVGGDLQLVESRVTSLAGSFPGALCSKGPSGSLAQVSGAPDCTGSAGWVQFLMLGFSVPGSAASVGDSLLVRPREGGQIYRMRIIGSRRGGFALQLELEYEPLD